MKYLLVLPEIKNEFNLDKILNYSNIDSCNSYFINLKNGKLLIELNEIEKINLNYINSLFEFLRYIVRDNFAMLNLAFRYAEEFRMINNNWILKKIILK